MENQDTKIQEPSTVTKTNKNPGRVEAGKRLSELNKKRKLQLQTNSEPPSNGEPSLNIPYVTEPYFYLGIIIPLGLLAAYKLYKKQVMPNTNKQAQPDTLIYTAHQTPTPPAKPDPFEMK